MVRRRIRAEALLLDDIDGPVEHLRPSTPPSRDARAGAGAAAADRRGGSPARPGRGRGPGRPRVDTAGPDPALKAGWCWLWPGHALRYPRQAACRAAEAIACAEAGGPTRAHAAPCALNLMIAKVTGGEGLDTGLLERLERLEDAAAHSAL
jgi:hypothetical protein